MAPEKEARADGEAGPPTLRAKELGAIETIRHAFFTRRGGVSGGLYRSLNCGPGSGDEDARVTENRARAAAHLGAAESSLMTLYQVHGRETFVAAPDNAEPAARRAAAGDGPRADALVTRTPGLALGILTADCAPILACDPEAGVIGAIHAGWKGALQGVVASAVGAMVELGAKPGGIVAVIGPCIGPRSYEVGPEFPELFLDHDQDNRRFFAPAPRDGHHLFDLAGFAGAELARAGVTKITGIGRDTFAEEHDFFSYRRGQHGGEPDYGRMLSAITLAG